MTFQYGMISTGITESQIGAGAAGGAEAAGGVHPVLMAAIIAAKIAKEVGMHYLQTRLNQKPQEPVVFDLSDFEPPKTGGIPNPSPMPGQRPLQSSRGKSPQSLGSMAQNTARLLQERYAQSIRDALALNDATSKGRGDLASALGERYPDLMPSDWQHPRQAGTSADFKSLGTNAEINAQFRELLNPKTKMPQIVPDTTNIIENLRAAKTPQTWHGHAMEIRQLHAEAAHLQAQREAAEAQKRYYKLLQHTEAARVLVAIQKKQQEQSVPANAEESAEVPSNLLSESGGVSIKYKPPNMGEKARGLKSNLPAKEITFSDDEDLANKLWDHFYNGQGQPVIINMTRLNFSNNLNVPKLFSPQSKAYIKAINEKSKNTKPILEKYTGKTIEKGFPQSNGKVTYIPFQDKFAKVGLKIEPDKQNWNKFAAFGRVIVDINNLELHIDHNSKTITVEADLSPIESSGLLDRFDFDSDPARGKFWNTITNEVHTKTQSGSTSFNIYGKGSSHLKQKYKFDQF